LHLIDKLQQCGELGVEINRDEFLNTELFTTAPVAQILADRWRWVYKSLRPHSALLGWSRMFC
jgi:hypothetical protein